MVNKVIIKNPEGYIIVDEVNRTMTLIDEKINGQTLRLKGTPRDLMIRLIDLSNWARKKWFIQQMIDDGDCETFEEAEEAIQSNFESGLVLTCQVNNIEWIKLSSEGTLKVSEDQVPMFV